MSFQQAREQMQRIRKDGSAPAPAPAPAPGAPAPGSTITDEDLIKSLTERGITVKSLEDLKKPAPAPEPIQKTPEQLQAEEQKRQKQRLDVFVEMGGTIDEFTKIGEVINTDGEQLAKAHIVNQIKSEGFTDEEAERIYRNRYYVPENETDDSFSDAQRSYGKKLRELRAEKIKKEAEAKLSKVDDAIKARTTIAEKANEWVAKAKEVVSGIEKKISIEVDSDRTFDFEISDDAIKRIEDIVSDPQKMSELLYNEDNSTNIKAIAELLKWAEIGRQMGAFGFTRGESQAIGRVKAVFPSNPIMHQPLDSGNSKEIAQKQGKAKAKANSLFLRNRPAPVS